MTFTAPPTFHRPEGNPAALREFATLLTSVAELLEQVGSNADRMSDRNSQLYWEGRPGDVFWDGTAQVNYIDAAIRRLRLVEAAGTTFREAGTVLGAVADHLVTAQMAVDEAQSVANQRATAGAASPVPTSFDQEQVVAATAGSLAAASGGEAASRLRALADSVPGYVSPAVASANGSGSELGARGVTAPIGMTAGGSAAGGTPVGATGAGRGSGDGSTARSAGSVAGGGRSGASVGEDAVSAWSSDATPGSNGASGVTGSAVGGATVPGAGGATSGAAATSDDGTTYASLGGSGTEPAASPSGAPVGDGSTPSSVGGSGAAGGGAAGGAAAAGSGTDDDERPVRAEEQE